VTILRLIAVAVLFVNVGRLHEGLVQVTGEFPIAKILLALGGIAMLATAPWARLRGAWRTAPARWLAVFTFALWLSLPFSYYRAASLSALGQFCFAVLPIVAITIAAVGHLADLEHLFRATALMVVVCGGLLVIGIGVSGDTRLSLVGSYDPNDFALVMATCLPFCIWCLRDRQRLWRVVGGSGVLVGLAALVKTGSRGGFLAVAVQSIVLLVVAREALPRWIRLAIVPMLVASVAFSPGRYRERLQTLTSLSSDYNTTELGGRQAIWRRGLSYFVDRPLTGVGVGQFRVAEGRWGDEQGYVRGWKWSAPHSMYIESAAELGIVGIWSLLAILWSMLRVSRGNTGVHPPGSMPDPRQSAAGVTIFLATITFAVGAAFLTAAFSPVFMMLISYAISYQAIRTGSPGPRSAPVIRGGSRSDTRRFNPRRTGTVGAFRGGPPVRQDPATGGLGWPGPSRRGIR
jgi:O-antigen ligase